MIAATRQFLILRRILHLNSWSKTLQCENLKLNYADLFNSPDIQAVVLGIDALFNALVVSLPISATGVF